MGNCIIRKSIIQEFNKIYDNDIASYESQGTGDRTVALNKIYEQVMVTKSGYDGDNPYSAVLSNIGDVAYGAEGGGAYSRKATGTSQYVITLNSNGRPAGNNYGYVVRGWYGERA